MNIDNIPGYANDNYPWDKIVERIPAQGTLLEAGAFCGLSTANFAKRLPNYSILTIEPCFGGIHLRKTISAKEQEQYLLSVVSAYDNVTWLKGYAWDIVLPKKFDPPTVFFYDIIHDYVRTMESLERMKDCPHIIIDGFSNIFTDPITGIVLDSKTAAIDFAERENRPIERLGMVTGYIGPK